MITTLSRDHLDYHKTYKDYKIAKLKLFSDVSNKGIAIINECVPQYKDFIEAAKSNNLKVITIGNSLSANWKYKIKNINIKEQEVEVTFDNIKTTIFTNLIGKYQINNLFNCVRFNIK